MTATNSQNTKIPLSVLIPIKNEAANLPRCLSSVSWADEIFVVDSGSTDGSQQIAETYGARVVQFHFSGTWPKKKNWALDNLPFSHPWIFILDADEVLPPEAKDELSRIVGTGSAGTGFPATGSAGISEEPVGYWINRRFFFMGKWLRHAYYPNWNLRLFKRDLGRYEMLTASDTASGDNEVHEHVIVTGKTGYLKAVMDHYAFPSVETFVEKHNRYSNWEARVAVSGMRDAARGGSAGGPCSSSSGGPGGAAGCRRKLKLLSAKLPCRPLLRFLYIYFWQRGFLDGIEGYYFARLHAYYEFLTVAKTFELQKQKHIGQD